MSSDEQDRSDIFNDLEQSVASFMATWDGESEGCQPSIEPPLLLHHYTDIHGLLGIVETGTLWASGVPFLNDQTELSHSLILLGQIIRGDRADADAGSPNDAADKYLNEIVANFYLLLEVYVVCFSQSPDLLSQWRAYGQGQGYAIGFKSNELSRMAILQRVIYNHHQQIQILSEFVRRWRIIFTEAKPEDLPAANARMVSLSLATALMRTIVGFKNEAFEEEQEWRLVRALPAFMSETLKFRDRSGMVMPYAEVLPPPDAPDGPKGQRLLPIESIQMGPRRDQNIAGHGLGKLLFTHGYIEVQTRWSDVPLRT